MLPAPCFFPCSLLPAPCFFPAPCLPPEAVQHGQRGQEAAEEERAAQEAQLGVSVDKGIVRHQAGGHLEVLPFSHAENRLMPQGAEAQRPELHSVLAGALPHAFVEIGHAAVHGRQEGGQGDRARTRVRLRPQRAWKSTIRAAMKAKRPPRDWVA